MTLVLDAGALIALDRNDRAMWIRLKTAHGRGEPPVTLGGVVGQVWRGGPRQARLATALAGVEVKPLDDELGRAAGRLLGATRTSDVVDAGVVLLAVDGDEIITADLDDSNCSLRQPVGTWSSSGPEPGWPRGRPACARIRTIFVGFGGNRDADATGADIDVGIPTPARSCSARVGPVRWPCASGCSVPACPGRPETSSPSRRRCGPIAREPWCGPSRFRPPSVTQRCVHLRSARGAALTAAVAGAPAVRAGSPWDDSEKVADCVAWVLYTAATAASGSDLLDPPRPVA